MAATFKIELNHKRSKDGGYCIFIRICQDRRYKRYKTAVSVYKKNDFNPTAKKGNWVKSSDPDYIKKNLLLKDELDAVSDTYQEEKSKGEVSIIKVAEKRKNGEVSPRFLPYAISIAEEIKDTGHIRNAKKYKNFCNKLNTFSPQISFVDIDTAFLKKFETHLLQLPNERKPDQRLSVNAVYAEMKTFRAIMNRARNIDHLIDRNPFENYHLKQSKTGKDKLTREEISTIENLVLEKGSVAWHTRNAFMLSFYCAGIRAGDLIQMRWGNIGQDGRICYQMDKNGKTRDLAMVRQAKEILDLYDIGEHKPGDYIFPFMPNNAPWAKYITYEQKKVMPVPMLEQMLNKVGSINAIFNKNLKRIAEQAGINKHVTFHVSRHSFATMALQENVDTMTIKGALAHASLQTTEGYLQEFNMSAIDTTLQRLFDRKPDLQDLLDKVQLLSKEDRKIIIDTLMKMESNQ